MLLKKRFLVFVFLIGFSSLIFGQIPTIDIDIRSGQPPTTPFDQKFRFKSFSTKASEVFFSYYIKDKPCGPNNEYYFCGTTKQDSIKLKVDPLNENASFPELIGPLHPNVMYEFRFMEKLIVSMELADENKLKTQVYNIIRDNYKINLTNQSNFNGDNIKKQIYQLVKKNAKVGVDQVLYTKVNGEDTVYTKKTLFNSSFLGNFLSNLSSIYSAIKRNIDNINTRKDKIIDSIESNLGSKTHHLKNSTNLNIQNKLNEKVNNSISDITNKQLIVLLKLDELENLTSILKGKSKIIDSTFLAHSNEYNLPDSKSISLLHSLFDNIKSLDIFSSVEKEKLKNIIIHFKKMTIEINNINNAISNMIELSKNVPNLLEDAFILNTVSYQNEITIPIEPQENNYIGFDAGLVYTFGLNSLMVYEGFNIYFSPINRDAELSIFKNRDIFLKRFSVFLGLAQMLSNQPNNFEHLLGKSSLIVGAGGRFNRIMRLNIGGVLHKKKDKNPLISKTVTKISPFISLSIDLDIVAGLGAVGKTLNLKD